MYSVGYADAAACCVFCAVVKTWMFIFLLVPALSSLLPYKFFFTQGQTTFNFYFLALISNLIIYCVQRSIVNYHIQKELRVSGSPFRDMFSVTEAQTFYFIAFACSGGISWAISLTVPLSFYFHQARLGVFSDASI